MENFGGFNHAYFVADKGQICDKLKHDMLKEKKSSYLAVIVFANAQLEFAKKNIIPLVSYWNYRSKDYISFFFVGYQGQEDNDSEFSPIIDHENNFHERCFVETIEEFEQDSGWEYGGITSIIICRANLKLHQVTGAPKVFLDFGNVIEFEIEKAQKEGVIDSVEIFFEALIKFARNNYGNNDLWKLSDVVGIKSVGGAIVDGIFEYLPKSMRRGARALDYFRIKNKS